MRKSIEERFWSKVDRRELFKCWEWTRSKTGKGYGQFSFMEKGAKRSREAHRMAWELTYGPIPQGLVVRHRCPGGPNRICCNPTHLRLGTQKDNSDDRTADGNTPRGEACKGAKLSENDVRLIRYLCKSKRHKQRDIATCFAVSVPLIEKISMGTAWVHAKGDWP